LDLALETCEKLLAKFAPRAYPEITTSGNRAI